MLAGQVIYGFLDGPGSREGGDGQLFVFCEPKCSFHLALPLLDVSSLSHTELYASNYDNVSRPCSQTAAGL